MCACPALVANRTDTSSFDCESCGEDTPSFVQETIPHLPLHLISLGLDIDVECFCPFEGSGTECLAQTNSVVDRLQSAKHLASDLRHVHVFGAQVIVQRVFIWLAVMDSSWFQRFQMEVAVSTQSLRLANQNKTGSTRFRDFQSPTMACP